MDTRQAIQKRRSIRKFSDKNISDDILLDLVNSACKAPSAKNRQPWFFHIFNNPDEKGNLIRLLKQDLENRRQSCREKGVKRPELEKAYRSLKTMESAPILIIVSHRKKSGKQLENEVNWRLHALDNEVSDLLSIGAAIQNLLLMATDRGLGSLWVCDIFYVYNALTSYFNTDDAIVSAICLGYFEKSPRARSRLPAKSVMSWQ